MELTKGKDLDFLCQMIPSIKFNADKIKLIKLRHKKYVTTSDKILQEYKNSTMLAETERSIIDRGIYLGSKIAKSYEGVKVGSNI